jgi:hypothetical protein
LRPGVSSSGETSQSARPSLGGCRRRRRITLSRPPYFSIKSRSRSGNAGRMTRLIDHQNWRYRAAGWRLDLAITLGPLRRGVLGISLGSAPGPRVLGQRTLAKLEVLPILGRPDETVPVDERTCR